MLVKLLRLIAEAGSADSAELAHSLGVTPALMQDMLDTLRRQGYLKRVVTDTSAACVQCPLRRDCRLRRQGKALGFERERGKGAGEGGRVKAGYPQLNLCL